MSPATSAICLATLERTSAGAAGTIRLRYLDSDPLLLDGTPIAAPATAAGSSGRDDFLEIGAAHNPASGRDTCWLVFSDDEIPHTADSYEIVEETGSVIHSYSYPGLPSVGEFVVSLTADSAHCAWLVVRVTDVDFRRSEIPAPARSEAVQSQLTGRGRAGRLRGLSGGP